MKIAIIGTGNLGISIAKGLLKTGFCEELYLTKRNLTSLGEFKEEAIVFLTKDNMIALEKCNEIILAVQPKQLRGVLNEIKDKITQKHQIISTVTGVTIDEIEKIIGATTSIARVMPNTAIAVEKSMTCISYNAVAKINKVKVETIFNALGTTIEIEEHDMQAATVLCASGVAFWMRLIRATMQGAIQLGFESNKALPMAIQTCLGAASLLKETKNHPEHEIDKVTTPKGCTIEGLNEMESNGMSAALIKGMLASFEKINQL